MKTVLMVAVLLVAQNSFAVPMTAAMAKEAKPEAPCPFRANVSLNQNTAATTKAVKEAKARGGRDGADTQKN